MRKKTPKLVSITLDERFLPILVRSLEGFMRFRSGQIAMALDEFYADKQVEQMKAKNYDHHSHDDEIENLVRTAYFKDLTSPGSAYGVGQYGFGADDAYALSKTLRQYLAYTRNDGYSGRGIDFSGYTGKYSSLEKPLIHGFDTRKFFPAPSSISKLLENLLTEGKHQAGFDLIDKKWPSLPRGEKYEIGYSTPSPQKPAKVGVWITAPQKPEAK